MCISALYLICLNAHVCIFNMRLCLVFFSLIFSISALRYNFFLLTYLHKTVQCIQYTNKKLKLHCIRSLSNIHSFRISKIKPVIIIHMMLIAYQMLSDIRLMICYSVHKIKLSISQFQAEPLEVFNFFNCQYVASNSEEVLSIILLILNIYSLNMAMCYIS